MKKLGIDVALVLVTGAVWVLLRTRSDETKFEKLVLTGSSTIAQLAAEIGKRFESLHSNMRVDVQTGGSSRGVIDARAGLAGIGMASWHPVQGLYKLTPMLSAALYSTLGAVLLATPLGIASDLFSRYYAPPFLAGCYRRLIELLTGIPSVVYGFRGLTTLAPLIGRLHQPGVGLLTGILVLPLMILPTMALTVDAALAAVPVAYVREAAALGLSRVGVWSWMPDRIWPMQADF